MNNEKVREPFVHITRRASISKPRAWGIRLLAIVIALVICGLVIFAMTRMNPVKVYGTMWEGAFGSARKSWNTIRDAMFLLCIGVGLAPAFKMRFWNIGAEGQVLCGGIVTAAWMIYFGNTMNSTLLLIVMGISSIIAGAIWGLIPALFKAKWGTNETLFTLMMNYIAIGIVAWLQGGPWEGKPGSQIIPMFDKKAVLPKLFGVHCGWVIVLLLVAFMFVYMNYTKHGYEIAVLGESENTAKYAGMNILKVTVRTAALSGAICGLVGFMTASGVNQTLQSGVAGGVGFTAITVCWLAQLNPFAMVAISFLLAVLSKGASGLQTTLSIPASISDIITGIILLCMLGCEFFINYRLIFRDKQAKNGKEAA